MNNLEADKMLAVWRWAVIENVATIICTLLGCWLVSGWFALLMLNINYLNKPKLVKPSAGKNL